MDKLQIVYLVCGVLALMLLIWYRSLFKIKYLGGKTIAKCGHETKTKGPSTAFGRTIIVKMPVNKDGSIEYCLDCIGKMAIRCAWCKEPIFIGDVITLYSPREKDSFELPEDSVFYDKSQAVVVGCGRTTCADTGLDYAGFWLPGENGEGKVHRHLTLVERSIIDLSKGGDGVIIQTH